MNRLKLITFILSVFIVIHTIVGFQCLGKPQTKVKQAAEGKLIEANIPAPSLEDNLFGIPTEQPVAIYLPPSYSTSDKKYPVVYFLPGFSTPVVYFTYWGVFQGFALRESIDRLIDTGTINEMIVVIPNGLTFMLGSFYVNSPVTGNWEDFIVKDVVEYIDCKYRTLPNAASRGISGHSMGGYGALNLAMLHPDVFGATYALSPGLFDKDGLSKNSMFASQNTINQYLAKEEEFKGMKKDEAKIKFMSFVTHLVIAAKDHDRVFSYAYGAAFSPNPDKMAPFIDYPYYKSDEEVVLDTTIWKNYENGFGGLAEKIERYKDNFLTLKGITIDYGINDNYKWIPEGCEYFSELLKEADIPHNLVKFEGGHGDKVRERIEKYMLPFFSNILEFE